MIIYFIRAIFIVTIAAFLFVSINKSAGIGAGEGEQDVMAIFITGMAIAATVIAVDWLTPKKSLNALAGIFFGLILGLCLSWAMTPVLEMIGDLYFEMSPGALSMAKWIMGICICYLTTSLVVRTKDDVRFMVPYIVFSRQTKGLRPMVLDTSVIIDGRIADIAETKLFDAPLIIPRFVLNELQLIADSPDKMKRNRGRRGLDILNKMQTSSMVDVKVDDTPPPGLEASAGVDQKLVAFSKNCDGRLVTNDYNLNKVAQLRGVDVININDLANALKTVTLPGETMQVKIIRPGEEAQQGIGYLDDGTMIVVEEARGHIGETIMFSVTSALQTSAGRMIFGKFDRVLTPAQRFRQGQLRQTDLMKSDRSEGMMNRVEADMHVQNAGRAWLVPGAVALITLVTCGVLAVGWTVQCGRLKTVNDRLANANETLRQDTAELQTQLATLAGRSGQTIDELMAMNRTLGDANEGLAAEIAGIRKTLETITAENLKRVDQITQLYEDARRQTAEDAGHVKDLAEAVMKLTEDSAAANSRLEGLVAQLQAKTDQAAEQAIRINTLVEMVARLRVLAGVAGEPQNAVPTVERLHDPNSTASGTARVTATWRRQNKRSAHP